jgi:hypothetical protein
MTPQIFVVRASGLLPVVVRASGLLPVVVRTSGLPLGVKTPDIAASGGRPEVRTTNRGRPDLPGLGITSQTALRE